MAAAPPALSRVQRLLGGTARPFPRCPPGFSTIAPTRCPGHTALPVPPPNTTQGRGADCLLSPLLFLWQPRAREGVAGGCAAPTAVPACPFLLQPKRLRCDRCSSARILPPRLPQEARAEGLGQSWKQG